MEESLEHPYFCDICFTQYNGHDYEAKPLTLSCGHTFCRSCLFQFLKNHILEGNLSPKCFKNVKKYKNVNETQPISTTTENMSDNKSQNYDPTEARIDSTYARFDIQECGVAILDSEIYDLIEFDKAILTKYKRFKFFQTNKSGCECPNASCGELLLQHSLDDPNMICTTCDTSFCFYHSTAHPDMTCDVYVATQAKENSLNHEYLLQTSKPCPSCGNLITKVSGCNHMKCRCGAAFCWVCGQAVDDETFPVHFQWWNVNGCTNMQMINDASVNPPRYIIYFARLRSFIQIIIFGPITLISALLSIILCPCCLFRRRERPRTFSEIFASLLTFWGMVYMMLIFGLPVGLLLCSFFLVWIIIYLVGYVIYRLFSKKFPWPDTWTVYFRAWFFRHEHPSSPESFRDIDISPTQTSARRSMVETSQSIPFPISTQVECIVDDPHVIDLKELSSVEYSDRNSAKIKDLQLRDNAAADATVTQLFGIEFVEDDIEAACERKYELEDFSTNDSMNTVWRSSV